MHATTVGSTLSFLISHCLTHLPTLICQSDAAVKTGAWWTEEGEGEWEADARRQAVNAALTASVCLPLPLTQRMARRHTGWSNDF